MNKKQKFALIEILLGDGESSQVLTEVDSTPTGLDFSAYIGKKVIIRSGQSGVHFGELAQAAGESVELLNSRRCWRWWAKDGISLSALAVNGLDLTKTEVRITGKIERMIVNGVCEIIPCSTDAVISFDKCGVANAR